MMMENKIDSNSPNFGANTDDRSSEESLEGSQEEERQTEYLEEPSSNEVDLGTGDDLPKRTNWFDRCGDCQGVPEDQVLKYLL